MTKEQEEFIEVLEELGYEYKIEKNPLTKGDRIIITDPDDLNFKPYMKNIPSGIEFVNKGRIILGWITNIPDDVIFNNTGNGLALPEVKSISPGASFGENFRGAIYIPGLIQGGFMSNWEGSILGISAYKLLNLMIENGIFNKEI